MPTSEASNASPQGVAEPDLRDKVLSALRWTVIGRFSAQIFRWASTIIVIRFLLPADYGLMSMVEVLFSLIIMMAGAGLADGLVKQRNISDATERSMLTMLIAVSAVLALIQWFTAPLLAAWFNEPKVTILLRVLCLALLFQPWLTLSMAMLKQAMKFRSLALSELLAAVLSSVLTLAFAIAGFGVWALVIGQLAYMLVSVLALCIARRKFTLPGMPDTELRGLLQFGALVSIGGILWTFDSRITIFLGGRILDATAIGYFAVAMHLAALAMSRLMPLIHQVGFPSYAQLDGDIVKSRFYLRKTMRLLALLVVPVFLGLAAIAEPLVSLVLGENWLNTVPMLMILCLAMPLRMAMQLYGPGLRALGRADLPLYWAAGSIVIGAACLLLLVRDNAMQMVWAYVIATPLCAALAHALADRVFKIGFGGILQDLTPPILAAVGMFITVTAYVQWANSVMPVVVVLVTAIILGALVYSAACWLLMRERANEALGLIKKRV